MLNDEILFGPIPELSLRIYRARGNPTSGIDYGRLRLLDLVAGDQKKTGIPEDQPEARVAGAGKTDRRRCLTENPSDPRLYFAADGAKGESLGPASRRYGPSANEALKFVQWYSLQRTVHCGQCHGRRGAIVGTIEQSSLRRHFFARKGCPETMPPASISVGEGECFEGAMGGGDELLGREPYLSTMEADLPSARSKSPSAFPAWMTPAAHGAAQAVESLQCTARYRRLLQIGRLGSLAGK